MTAGPLPRLRLPALRLMLLLQTLSWLLEPSLQSASVGVGGTGEASLKDRLVQCRRFCPTQCRQCEFRYAFAQYHLSLDCGFALGSGELVARLIECETLAELNVLVITRVERMQEVLPKLATLTKLTHLNLTDNRIRQLPPRMFSTFKELKELVLDRNLLENLTDNSLATPSLQKLSIIYNRIRYVSSKAFELSASYLNYIDLSYNRLGALSNWPLRIRALHSEEKLRVLLDHNLIERFDDTDGGLDQQQNEASRIQWTKELVTRINLVLSLTNNKVRHLVDLIRGWNLDDKTIRELGVRHAITIISLHQNPLECDCLDYNMYVSASNISHFLPDPMALPYCVKPVSLNYQSVFNSAFKLLLKREDLVCRGKCKNEQCMCTEEPWRQTVSVDCFGVNLGRLPHRRELAELPDQYVYRFNFSASRLSRALPGMPGVYRDAQTLDLRGTGIENLPIKFLNKLRRLEIINLNHNLFTELDRRIVELAFPHLKEIRLDHNPWSCHCNNSWLTEWLHRMRPYLRHEDDMRCAEPSWLFNRPLLSLRLRDFCDRPDPRSSNRSYDQLALSSSAVSGVLALVTLAFFLLFCARVSLFTRFGFHPFDRDECTGELKRCDAFVLFHPSDSDWVVSVLLEKLTNRKSPYVLCTHDRACIPGLLTYSAVCHAVENSKRVIAVITESFISDVDVCTDYQLTVTFLTRTQPRQANRLIHILFPNIKHLPQNLLRRNAAASKSIIRYGKKNFWKQVLYRMPLTTVNQLSASKTASSNTRDYSSSFHTLNEDQRGGLLNKTGQQCVSYSNVYEASGERQQQQQQQQQCLHQQQLELQHQQQQQHSSQLVMLGSRVPSVSSLSLYPSIVTFPRASRMSTFRVPDEDSAVSYNEATL